MVSGGGAGPLAVISAMITPAILILATGSLIQSTLVRIARIVDRARALLDRIAQHRAQGDELGAELLIRWLRGYRRRSFFAERALVLFYVATFAFVAASLAIAVIDIARGMPTWFPVFFTVAGAVALLVGAVFLVIETQIATDALRDEIRAMLGTQRGEPHAAPLVRSESERP